MKRHNRTNEVQKLFSIFVVFCFVFLGQSCSDVSSSLIASQTPSPSFTPTSEEVEFIDCGWRATGKAWNDDNQNGVWDSGEKALANVKFWVDDTLNNYQKVNEFYSETVTTNAEGNIEIFIFLPGCPEVELEVYTETPQHCTLTTQERIPINFNSQYPVYSFGFVCDDVIQ